ncbi:putative Holliday junction resolvase [Candidatus Phytoplasma phoenicium]|uniref:Putative pre-16S rRNA nuclease n=1 Tax=Candidatus Phytoplasma phoenicium TaxID=198422 RepID=A0A0L0MKT9_9MOLU|nr:putative Holliday junction resolvase [Candidatus Phytoplasma phoenicium]
MGLDLGEKTLGIAISHFGIIAQKLKTIMFTAHQYQELLKPLKKIIDEFKVKTIVLGQPKHMNNDIGIKATISILFKKQIQKFCDSVEIILWDERLSTKQAQIIIKTFHKKKDTKKLKDEIAATIILQNFLNYRNNFK